MAKKRAVTKAAAKPTPAVDWRTLPRTDDPRDITIRLRVTASEDAAIRANADAAGQSLSDFLRSVGLRKPRAK